MSNIKSVVVQDIKIRVRFRFDLKAYFNITLQCLFQSIVISKTNTYDFFSFDNLFFITIC